MESYKSQVYGNCYAEWLIDESEDHYCIMYHKEGEEWVSCELLPGEADGLECAALWELVEVLKEHGQSEASALLEEWLKLDAKTKTTFIAALAAGGMMGGCL